VLFFVGRAPCPTMLRDFIRASLGFINKYMAKGLPYKTSSGSF
jgi:hypothetical protein